ncbi:DUF4355 domain-containing protein [Listeria kieliensis]
MEEQQNNEELNQNETKNSEEQNDKETQQDNKDELTLTQSELDRMLDKRLEKAREKWEAKKQEEIENAKDEAARLAKLSKDEREQEETKKREESLEKREKAIRLAELEIETRKQLSENGLPEDFSSMVINEDAEIISNNIKNMRQAFDEAVKKEVNERLSQNTVKRGNGSTSLTKEAIMNIRDTNERQRLIAENRNLF